MFNKLSELIKKIEGNVLVIGLDSKLIDSFDKNSNVNLFSISRTYNIGLSKKSKMHTNKGKNISIKKLKKYINKKSVDYMIINMNEIYDYYKYIIRDSIILNKGKIIVYSNNDIDKDFLIERFKRYNVKINYTEYKAGYILTIENHDNKKNIIKNIRYFIKDTFYNIAEFIGNILVS